VRIPRDKELWKACAVVGLLNGALPFFLISWGEQYIPSGLAALLQATTPIFTVLLAHFLSHDERITLKKLSGVALGFVGVGLLLLPDLQRGGMGNSVLGQLAIVGSSLSYALSSIFSRRRLTSYSPLLISVGQFTMGFVYIFPLSVLIERPFYITPSARALASWAALALIGSVLAYSIYYTLLNRTSATFATSVTYLIPISGLILGAVVLGERITPMILVSLALVLSGVLLVRGKERV
jgi:drug/metabolite transporter (DMT)-like permease